MSDTKNKKPYQLYLATVRGTNWPIDGHRLVFGIWDYSPETYSLMDWDVEKDDEAVMMTFFKTEVEAGFENEDSLEAFKKTWNAGKYECPAAFHLDPENVADVEKIEKSPYMYKNIL